MHKLTNDRWKWGVAALLAGVVLGFAPFTQPYVWWRLPWASVTFEGRLTTRASVYRSSEGQLLVWIAEPGGAAGYIVDPAACWIAEPSHEGLLDDAPETNHFWVCPFFALVMDDRFRPRWSHHYDDDEPTRNAIIRPRRVDFSEPDSIHRVRVRF